MDTWLHQVNQSKGKGATPWIDLDPHRSRIMRRRSAHRVGHP